MLPQRLAVFEMEQCVSITDQTMSVKSIATQAFTTFAQFPLPHSLNQMLNETRLSYPAEESTHN